MSAFTVDRSSRFISFIIDMIVFTIVVVVILILFQYITKYKLDSSVIKFISLAFYFIYYSFFETLFKSTPGKMATGTKVVTESGEIPNPKDIIYRSMVRLIPFEPISIFFNSNKLCWHDKLAKTKVIKINN